MLLVRHSFLVLDPTHGVPLLQRPFVALAHAAALVLGHATPRRLNHAYFFRITVSETRPSIIWSRC
jgi:hypothetical protein